MPVQRASREPVAFEDLTTPEQRAFGVYLISSPDTGYSRVFTGSYRMARRLARGRTRFGDVELRFLEPMETPAVD
jgi:hypothetical protein